MVAFLIFILDILYLGDSYGELYFSIFSNSWGTLFLLFALVVLFMSGIFLKRFKLLKSSNIEKTDELRDHRREVYLEEKLRKLEALRDADFNTIVKTNAKLG